LISTLRLDHAKWCSLFISRKSVNNSYEEYVLSVGDFDERIFLGEDAEEEIGTPAKSQNDLTGELQSSLQQHVDQVWQCLCIFCPPFEEERAYCFAHVGRSVCPSV